MMNIFQRIKKVWLSFVALPNGEKWSHSKGNIKYNTGEPTGAPPPPMPTPVHNVIITIR